jgi:type IV pilus assembly protein PilC
MNISEQQKTQARFWKKFLRLTRGRVPVLRALAVIAAEEHQEDFKAVIGDIRSAMAADATFSEALERHSNVFSLSIRELVRTAEKCGEWDEIIEEIAAGIEEGTFD